MLMAIGFLTACAHPESPAAIRYQSGHVVQVARCPVGEYEVCLQQISNACQEAGYAVQEKVRQIKSGFWSDTAETLIVAQCNKAAPSQ
jgi:hypothetical protein